MIQGFESLGPRQIKAHGGFVVKNSTTVLIEQIINNGFNVLWGCVTINNRYTI